MVKIKNIKPELAGKLGCSDFSSQETVDVTYEDGSHCHYRYAFWRREGDWIVVYSEHCGYIPIWALSITRIFGRERT